MTQIIRATLADKHFFNEELFLRNTCFISDDKQAKYAFKIVNEKEAIVFYDNPTHLQNAIDSFLFLNGFISVIKNPSGTILKKIPKIPVRKMAICEIQPSQFYINQQKLSNCKKWIQSEKDIIIPVTYIDGAWIALDGHTRLRAGYDLGYSTVNVFEETGGDFIKDFVKMTREQGKQVIQDLEVLPDVTYQEKWHRFCEDYFQKH